MSFVTINLSNIEPSASAYLAFDNTNGFRIFQEVTDNNVAYLHDITADPPIGSLRILSTKCIVDGALVTDLDSSNAFDGFEDPGQILKIDEGWYNVNSHIDDNNVTVDRNLSFNAAVSFSGSTVTTQGANSFVNGQRVAFRTTGSLPTTVSVDGIYYVVAAAEASFSISLTPGGSAIAFSGVVAGQVKAFRVHEVYTTTYLPNQLNETLLGIITNTAGVYTLQPFYSVNDSNVSPIAIVTSLPPVGEYEGQVVINSTDNNIYTWNGLAWVTTTANTSRTVSMTTTAQAFSYTSNGDTPDPASATITATTFNTEGTVYYEFLVDGVTVQNSVTNTYSYIPRAAIADMPDVIEVKIREGSTITPVLASDQLTCFGVAPGSDAITILLSNEAHTLPSDSDGSNTNYTGSGTTIRVYRGNQLVPYSATLASDPSFKVTIFDEENVIAGSISGVGTTVTIGAISTMTATRGSVVYDITVLSEASETIYQKVQSFAKSLAGVPGAGGSDSVTVQLTSDDYSIIYDTTDANPAPASVTLTAQSQNISTPYYTFRESSATGTILQASSIDDTLVITSPAASYTPARTYWVGVAATLDGTIIAYDTISLFSIRQSLDGENAYTVIVSNEAHTVPASSAGSVTSYSGSGTRIECYIGATELQYVTGTPTAGQFSVSSIGSNITPGSISTSGLSALVADHSSMTATVATVTYTINLENIVSIEKVQSITKSLQGAAGSLGTGAAIVKIDVDTYVITYAADGTTPSPSGTFTLTANAQNITDPWFKFTATPTIGGFDEATYTDGTGDADTKTFTIPSTYFATPYKFRVDVSDGDQAGLAFDTVSVYAVRPGLNAITAFLTNEAHTVATAFDGTGASYTTAGGTFTVYNGVTDVTTSSTFAISGGTDGGATWTKVQNGLTFTINETTGVYSLSGAAWTSDSESFTATATFGGVTISKTYTISKSKAGQPSTIYYVVSSADALKRNADNTLVPTNVTFSALTVVGNAAPASYAGRFRVYRNETLVYSSAGNESSYTYTPATPATLSNIRVELYQAGGFTTVLDGETIPVVQDGSDAVTVSIDNENVSFPGPAAGFSGINFGTATSTIRVYRGSTLLSYAASGANTFSCTQVAVGVTVAAGVGSGNTFVLPVPTAMSAVNAYTDVTVAVRNPAGVESTQTVRITYTLARAGNDSTSYWLVSSADVVKKALDNTLSPASLTFTAYSAVGIATPALYAGRFRVSRNGVVVYTSIANETSYSYTPATPSSLTEVKVELFLAGGTITKLDEEIIPIVLDGTDALTVSVDNENNSYPASSTGFAGITFGSATSTIKVYKGSAQLNYNTSGANTFSCTQAATNVTVATGTVGGGNSFIIPVPTAMAADTAYLDVTVTIRDAAAVVSTQNVRITYSLARRGVQGTVGGQGTTGTTGVTGARGAGRWHIPVASLPTNNTTAQAAWDTAWTGKPGVQVANDQAWFYTGTQANPTGQAVFIYTGGVWNLQNEVIDGNLLVTNTITGGKLVAGSVSADKLSVGIGTNAIRNSDFSGGNTGWTISASDANNPNTIVVREIGESWTGPAERSLMLHQANGVSTGFSDVRYVNKSSKAGTNYGLRVAPGDRVALRCNISAHRCVAELRIEWKNAAGSALSYSAADTNSAVSSSSTDPLLWPLLTCIDTAPAGAYWASIHIRKVATNAGQVDSYMFWYRPMIAVVDVNATQVPVFSHGSYTSIEGGAINTTSLSAISADLGVITAGEIRSGTTGENRLIITPGVIEVYDAANVRRVRLGVWV